MYENLVTADLETALYAGYIDGTAAAKEQYLPKLLTNDVKKQTKVLTSIISELESCDEFLFSVAFVTNSGVECLIDTLLKLQGKGIKGKILASQYQNFTEPRALKRLIGFDNIEVRIQTENNFHAKGYLFRHGTGHTLIIGSSNLTQNALCENNEWNLRVSSFEKGSIVSDIRGEFDRQFADATIVDDEYIRVYSEIYKYQRIAQIKSIEDIRNTAIVDVSDAFRPSPNKMQKEALSALANIRGEGADKALLISATGTGKTYLSAFDASAFGAKKLLFVVHRENIARAAKRTFQRVFGKKVTMGMYTGLNKADADFLFCTVQTISKPEYYEKFRPDEFDYIVVDEVHRSGAASYQRMMDYFKPKFMLGMSATPERTDGYDIFKRFDYNIAYEIRLQEALAQNMLSPFHYHGITDLTVNGEMVDDATDFKYLTSDERVKHIYDITRFYGCDRGRIKGLIFCSRVEEAAEIAKKLQDLGVKAAALTGADNEDRREAYIELLESDDPDNYLEYLITVDIFNEGVDIPSVNQVVMLRPTQSAIIFVQQLGRGLRKLENKDYVVVLDFIGNYKKSFLIPIALSGDKTYNKDTVRRCISEGSRIIPGCSTIEFDEIAKERIFHSLDLANFSDIQLIKDSYKLLKFRIGRIPTLMDFDKYGSIDPLRIFDSPSLGSYYTFLSKYEKEYTTRFDDKKQEVLKSISKKLAAGKRIHELYVLKNLLDGKDDVLAYLSSYLKSISIDFSGNTRQNVINVLTNNFTAGSAKDSFSNCVFIQPAGDDYSISDKFAEMLSDKAFYDTVLELVDFGIYRSQKDYSDHYGNTPLVLYAKYTYEDVCRLLDWEKSEVPLNIGGYKFDKKTKTYPVFINYNKEDDIADTIKYNDHFESSSRLIAISKSKRSVDSDDVQTALNADTLGVAMHLFVRKNKDDKISKEFYYLGRIHATGKTEEFIMPGTTSNAVEIEYYLDEPIPDSLFGYITG